MLFVRIFFFCRITFDGKRFVVRALCMYENWRVMASSTIAYYFWWARAGVVYEFNRLTCRLTKGRCDLSVWKRAKRVRLLRRYTRPTVGRRSLKTIELCLLNVTKVFRPRSARSLITVAEKIIDQNKAGRTTDGRIELKKKNKRKFYKTSTFYICTVCNA